MAWIIIILFSLIGAFLLFILFTIFCSAIVNTHKEYKKESKLYRFLLNTWTGISMRFIRIKVVCSGLENIPSDSNFLLVGNHRSNFDPIITWYILKKYHIAFISKEENFHVPFFGRIIRKCCFMPIDRENPRNALKTINRAAELLKDTNLSVGIYPEGTRNKTEEPLLPFHNGSFKIAKKANVPIVVLTVKNTEMIHKNFPLHSTKVFFDISDVIPAQTVAELRTADIGERVKNSLLNSLGYKDNLSSSKTLKISL